MSKSQVESPKSEVVPPGPMVDPMFSVLPVSDVKPGPWNPRKHRNQARQDELVASVKQHGVIQPIVVRAGGSPNYLVIAGTRRLEAAVAAGLTFIPAMVHNSFSLTDAQCQEIACLENLNRTDIHPLDEAEAFARLRKVDRAYTDEAIAARFGKSVAYVKRRMALLTLAPVIKAAFLADVLTASHAEKLAKVSGEKAQLEAFSEGCFFEMSHVEVLPAAKAGRWEELLEWIASPASLQQWLDQHTRLDVNDLDQQERLPGLAAVAVEAEHRGGGELSVVQVSRQYSLSPAERKALPGVLARGEYTIIDAKRGWGPEKKSCPSAERSLVVHGGRPDFVKICRDKACPVHHPTPTATPDSSAAEKREPSKWELQDQRRRKQQAAFGRLKGSAFRAMAPALLKGSTSAALVRDMVGGGLRLAEVSKRFGFTLSEKTATATLLASHVIDNAWSRSHLAKICKLIGFNLDKFIRDQAKTAKQAKAATVAAKPKSKPVAKAKKTVAKKAKKAA